MAERGEDLPVGPRAGPFGVRTDAASTAIRSFHRRPAEVLASVSVARR